MWDEALPVELGRMESLLSAEDWRASVQPGHPAVRRAPAPCEPALAVLRQRGADRWRV